MEAELRESDSVILQCRRRLLHLEASPRNSSLLLEAAQWALSSLSSPGPVPGQRKRKAEGEAKKKPAPEPEAEGSGSLRSRGAEASGWQDAAGTAAKGGAGERMAALIEARLSLPSCAALSDLLRTCLLLSLDPDGRDDSGESWMHKWLARLLMPSHGEQGTPAQPEDDSQLDWLVAHLATADSHLFLEAFINRIAGQMAECRATKRVSLSTLARQGMILEYISHKVGELAAMRFLSSLSCFLKREKACDYPIVCLTCCASTCLIMGFVCPEFFGICARLLVSKLSLESIKKYAKLFQDQHCGEVFFDSFTEIFKIIELEQPKSPKMCLYDLFAERLPCLYPVAVDTVCILNQICKSTSDPIDKDIFDVGHFLLESISKKLYQLVLLHKSGPHLFDKEGSSCLLLENLQKDPSRLWDETICRASELLLKHSNQVAPFSTRQCTSFLSSEVDVCIKNLYEQGNISVIKGCIYEDSFIQICILTILSCDERVVANILANSTTITYSGIPESDTFARLFMVTNIMELFATKKETQMVYNHWAKNVSESVLILRNEEALSRVLALRKILDLSAVFSSSSCNLFRGWHEFQGVDKLSYSNEHLKHALECQWLEFLSLLERDMALDLGLTVLGILQLLLPNKCTYSQTFAVRLKRLLGLLFLMLERSQLDCNFEVGQRWKLVQLIEQLKRLIIHLARSSYIGFIMMVNSLIDYSFQEAYHSSATVKSCSGGTYSAFPSTKYWTSGRLNQYGRFEIVSRHDSKTKDVEACKGSGAAHLGNLLCRTCEATLRSWRCHEITWPSHPISLLSILLVDRLRTPHDIATSTEQYEQVLPKRISTPRHMFLIDCFRRNPFLFKVLSIVIEKGGHSELLSSLELIRALLADSISTWYNSYQFHRTGSNEASKVNIDQVDDRLPVFELIGLISSAGLLPVPLASSSEIISLIDGADVAELLLLIWQSMHHNLTFHQEIQKVCDNSLAMAIGTSSTAIEDFGDKGSNTASWEHRYFEIIRKNVANIGPHFSQLYPKH